MPSFAVLGLWIWLVTRPGIGNLSRPQNAEPGSAVELQCKSTSHHHGTSGKSLKPKP